MLKLGKKYVQLPNCGEKGRNVDKNANKYFKKWSKVMKKRQKMLQSGKDEQK